MTPQLTLHTPIQLPPNEISNFLDKLWANDQPENSGANTFCLIIWQPAWLEQHLARTGKINRSIIGAQHEKITEAARKLVIDNKLPHSTPPFDSIVTNCISKANGKKSIKDLRGQHIDSSISELKPRRLITLAPTLINNQPLESLVAAYCPLPEEGGGNSACGDVIVLRGGINSINKSLPILSELLPDELPSWLWWNGSLNEAKELLNNIALPSRRLIIDTAIGDPYNCLEFLENRISTGQAVNDLNWLRLRSWRETLAMVFDPPERQIALANVINLDIDVQGSNPVQGLLLASWIANRLNWEIKEYNKDIGEYISIKFKRPDNEIVNLRLTPIPIGSPSIHPGQIVGLRLICKQYDAPENELCVILGAETGECMRLEAGGMANMELLEEVVPNQKNTVEMDVARLLSSSRGTTSPLLSAAAPLAAKLYNLARQKN